MKARSHQHSANRLHRIHDPASFLYLFRHQNIRLIQQDGNWKERHLQDSHMRDAAMLSRYDRTLKNRNQHKDGGRNAGLYFNLYVIIYSFFIII